MLSKRSLCVVGALLSVTALAQSSTALPRVNLDRLILNPSGSGSLILHDGALLGVGNGRVGLVGQYVNNLSLDRSTDNSVVMDRLYGTVVAAYGITPWLEITGQLPLVITQGRSLPSNVREPPGSTLAPPALSLRGGISESAGYPLSLSVELGAAVPLGESAALVATADVSRPTPYARLNLGKDLGFARLFAEVNVLEHIDYPAYGGDPITDEVGGGAGVYVPLPAGFALEGAGLIEYDFENPGYVAQLHAGVRWQPTKSVTFFAGGGPAFGDLVGTPDWRLFGGMAFQVGRSEPPARGPATPSTPLAETPKEAAPKSATPRDPCAGPNANPSECPDADLDSDGIANRDDRCISQPEDLDGFNDGDGCAEEDNDGDSIADGADKCPTEAGVPKYAGCPIPDADKDGISDADDACPQEYGMVAARGCPVKDADGDSLADARDACPTKAGIVELKGCPTADRDADGVFDHLDNCPKQRGLTDNGGCPAAKKQLVLLTPDHLELRDKVFFVAKKARVQPRSNKLLKQVATVLKQAKHIDQVRIEVHGDDDLNPDKNRKLTQDRADAVRAALVKAGIAPDRLIAVGKGNDEPIDPKRTFKAKATNRRVEFHIVLPDTPATM